MVIGDGTATADGPVTSRWYSLYRTNISNTAGGYSDLSKVAASNAKFIFEGDFDNCRKMVPAGNNGAPDLLLEEQPQHF